MDLLFTCPLCKSDVTADEELAGKKAPCPSCREVIVLPICSTRNGKTEWTSDEVREAIHASVSPYHKTLADRDTQFHQIVNRLKNETKECKTQQQNNLELQSELWRLEAEIEKGGSASSQKSAPAEADRFRALEKDRQVLENQLLASNTEMADAIETIQQLEAQLEEIEVIRENLHHNESQRLEADHLEEQEKLETQNRTLIDTIKALSDRATGSDERLDKQKEALKLLKDECASLRKANQSLEKTCSELNEQQEAIQKLDEESAELRESNEALQASFHELNEQKGAFEKLDRECTGLREANQSLEKTCNELKEQKEDLSSTMMQEEVRVEEMEARLSENLSRQADSQQTILELREELESQGNQFALFKKEQSQPDPNIELLQEVVANLELKNRDLLAKSEQQHKEGHALRERQKTVDTENHQLSAERDKLDLKLKEARATVERLEKNHEEYQFESETAHEDLAQLTLKVSTLEEKCSHYLQEIESSERVAEEQCKRAENVTLERDNLNTELDKLSENFTTMNEELHRLQHSQHDGEEEQSHRVDALTSERDDLKVALDKLQDNFSRTNEALHQAQNALQDLEEEKVIQKESIKAVEERCLSTAQSDEAHIKRITRLELQAGNLRERVSDQSRHLNEAKQNADEQLEQIEAANGSLAKLQGSFNEEAHLRMQFQDRIAELVQENQSLQESMSAINSRNN